MNEAVKRAVVALDYHLGDDSPDPISKTAFAAIVALVTPLMAELNASEARNAEAMELLSDAGLLLALLHPEQADLDKWREGVNAWLAQSAPATEFSTPDCPDCACVQDGQCLCTPSKPSLAPTTDEQGAGS